ncbi:MAG: sulfite exporter TauE/SafE family protein [Rhodospirillales bacterium]|nr:MAG: sulfite exporter TauE/SafE family protein [Rhodospirillales bacterium]
MSWSLAALGVAVFLVAGGVKGLVGLGLPTVSIALLAVVMPVPEAMALLTLPTIVTNVWQAAVGGRFMPLVRRLWPLILTVCVVVWLTVSFVGRKAPTWAMPVLGAVLIVYGAMGLGKLRFHVAERWERWASVPVGAASGFVAGIVGVPIIPLMPYLQALEMKPAELVQALGIVLCAVMITITATLAGYGVLDAPRAAVSAAAVVPAMAGMWCGQRVRRRLSVDQFRVVVFVALLLLGVHAVLKSLY